MDSLGNETEKYTNRVLLLLLLYEYATGWRDCQFSQDIINGGEVVKALGLKPARAVKSSAFLLLACGGNSERKYIAVRK